MCLKKFVCTSLAVIPRYHLTGANEGMYRTSSACTPMYCYIEGQCFLFISQWPANRILIFLMSCENVGSHCGLFTDSCFILYTSSTFVFVRLKIATRERNIPFWPFTGEPSEVHNLFVKICALQKTKIMCVFVWSKIATRKTNSPFWPFTWELAEVRLTTKSYYCSTCNIRINVNETMETVFNLFSLVLVVQQISHF